MVLTVISVPNARRADAMLSRLIALTYYYLASRHPWVQPWREGSCGLKKNNKDALSEKVHRYDLILTNLDPLVSSPAPYLC
jgi:hypothetical protein